MQNLTEITCLGTVITRQQVLDVMARYDVEYPDNDYCAGTATVPWHENRTYKYAVVHAGRLYPPKYLASLLTGRALVGEGLQGSKVPIIFERLGFEVKRLRLPGDHSPAQTAAADDAPSDTQTVGGGTITQELLIELETALHRLVESFWEEAYRYFTEADALAAVQFWIERRPELAQAVRTADGYETTIVHREYPTFFHYDKTNPVARLGPPAARGHYDLVVIDPAYVRKHPAQTVLNRRERYRAGFAAPPLVAAAEFKLFARGWSPGRIRNVRRDLGKLRLTLQSPAHAQAAYYCLLQRVVSQRSARSDEHWLEVRQMVEEAAGVRTVVAVCWPKQDREPFVHYSGPWITITTM